MPCDAGAGRCAAGAPACARHRRDRLHRHAAWSRRSTSAGHDVTVLTRDPAKAATLRPPLRMVTDLAQIAGRRADRCRDQSRRRADRQRTVDAAQAPQDPVVAAAHDARRQPRLIARLQQRPAVLVSGSAIGWYGLWQDETLTEFDGGKRCFTHRVCDSLGARGEEGAAPGRARGAAAHRPGARHRGRDAAASMLIPFEFGLGGPFGSGRQWMSWIERDDLVRLIAHVIATPSLTGAGECDRAGAGDATKNSRRRSAGALRRPALLRMPAVGPASSRRRVRRRADARRPARHSRQGAG